MQTDRTYPTETLERTLATLEPDWRLRDARLADSGHLSVYFLDVETDEGPREVVLKASPDGETYGIGVEARLLALLGAETSIPVPRVFGAVDDHETIPAPCVLMESMPGRTIYRDEYGDVDDELLAGIARDTGRHLAELHAVDAVDAFGYLEPAGPTLRGETPPADPDAIAVADPDDSWEDCLSAWVEGELATLADGRFGDLTDDVAPVLRRRVADLEGRFEPTLAHVDASIENYCYEPGRGTTGMIDWAFTVAAPPAYDLACVEHSLAGGHWRYVPDVRGRRSLVREALLEGYGATAPAVVDRYRRHRRAYDLLTTVRTMHLFEDWFAARTDLSEATVDRAAEAIRRELTDSL